MRKKLTKLRFAYWLNRYANAKIRLHEAGSAPHAYEIKLERREAVDEMEMIRNHLWSLVS